jgi:hypothetical protein
MCEANKQFFAVIPVICKVFQTGKRFSAITQVICKVCHSGKQFSAVNQSQMTGMIAENCFLA